MKIKAVEIAVGDHLVSVDGVVLNVAPPYYGPNAGDRMMVTYSPTTDERVLTGFWGPEENVEVRRGRQD